ncbi:MULTISPECIES: S1C family serine protease [Clostridium]|uniref:S1C family serine protease n=1 Tax=Clostridium TaxID=1485 RepID=UPI000824391B|nr:MULTISPECIES: trypsin-like peptidase domain-containing protein [Clostridium]PJI08781.1 protease [Clostridium sp. CT7]
MFDDKNEIEDVTWKEVNTDNSKNNVGNINFRNSGKSKFKKLFKLLTFIAISVLSGAITATYVVNTRYYELTEKSNTPMFQEKKSVVGSNNSIPVNSVNKVSDEVGSSIVGIVSSSDASNHGPITGSGVIFKSDGYIVTNSHLISDANKILVRLSNGKEFDSKVIASDGESDIAIIKVNGHNLPTAIFGDSSKVRVGDIAVAVGNFLGDKSSGDVTAGIISAASRSLKASDDSSVMDISNYRVLQTSAIINSGNSGGALCNEKGEVIGINSDKLNMDYDSDGASFAVSINDVKEILDQLMKNGKVIKTFVGIVGGDLKDNSKSKLEGVYVKEVVPRSSAAEAGIKPSDIILELDGQRITTIDDIGNVLNSKKVGDKVLCKVNRNGKLLKLQIVLTENKN